MVMESAVYPLESRWDLSVTTLLYAVESVTYIVVLVFRSLHSLLLVSISSGAFFAVLNLFI